MRFMLKHIFFNNLKPKISVLKSLYNTSFMLNQLTLVFIIHSMLCFISLGVTTCYDTIFQSFSFIGNKQDMHECFDIHVCHRVLGISTSFSSQQLTDKQLFLRTRRTSEHTARCPVNQLYIHGMSTYMQS